MRAVSRICVKPPFEVALIGGVERRGHGRRREAEAAAEPRDPRVAAGRGAKGLLGAPGRAPPRLGGPDLEPGGVRRELVELVLRARRCRRPRGRTATTRPRARRGTPPRRPRRSTVGWWRRTSGALRHCAPIRRVCPGRCEPTIDLSYSAPATAVPTTPTTADMPSRVREQWDACSRGWLGASGARPRSGLERRERGDARRDRDHAGELEPGQPLVEEQVRRDGRDGGELRGEHRCDRDPVARAERVAGEAADLAQAGGDARTAPPRA